MGYPQEQRLRSTQSGLKLYGIQISITIKGSLLLPFFILAIALFWCYTTNMSNNNDFTWFQLQLNALINKVVAESDTKQCERIKEALSEALGHLEDEPVRFTLPLPPDLNEWLKQQAELYDRSKTGHIVFLLKAIRDTSVENQRRLSEVEIGGD